MDAFKNLFSPPKKKSPEEELAETSQSMMASAPHVHSPFLSAEELAERTKQQEAKEEQEEAKRKRKLQHQQQELQARRLSFAESTSLPDKHPLQSESPFSTSTAPASSFAKTSQALGGLTPARESSSCDASVISKGSINLACEDAPPAPARSFELKCPLSNFFAKIEEKFDNKPLKIGITLVAIGGLLIGVGIACAAVTPVGKAFIAAGAMLAFMGAVLLGIGFFLHLWDKHSAKKSAESHEGTELRSMIEHSETEIECLLAR